MSDMRDTRDMHHDKDTMEANMPVEPERPREERRPMPTTEEPIRTNRDGMPAQAPTQAPSQMEMWPDMADVRRRFDEIQSEFIGDPKEAVKKAERLMDEAIERITKTMHERMQSMHRDVDGKDGDTEMLRLTMVSYRQLMDAMGNRRAA